MLKDPGKGLIVGSVLRGQIIWAAITALLLVAIGLGLRGSPEVALQYWYLLGVPLMVAALRFGRRGAMVVAGIDVLILCGTFQASGAMFSQATAFLGYLIEAASSPQESARLAFQLADLKAADPRATFARALVGMTISIVGAIILGNSVDHRTQGARALASVYERLRQYCPPQIAQALAASGGVADLNIPTLRKEITVLFADLRGFTTLSERLDPEEVADLLNEFFTVMTEEILVEDGCLDKYIGDEVMAFFGDPIEHPDHPQRAFRAALAMQRRMRELNNSWQARGREAVGMGIGVASGHATVGITGSPTRMEYTALGSIVNVASRLSDVALPGQTLTTRKTYWRVQDMVDGISRGPTTIKGFTQPVEVIAVVGERIARNGGETQATQRWTEVIATVVHDSAYRGLLLWNPDEGRHLHPLSDDELRVAQHVAVLSGYPIFRDVPPAEIASLMTGAAVEEHSEGAMVVQQGAVEDKFYVLLKGDVVIAVRDEQARERHVASLSRGDHFGEVSLLFDTPRTATVRTMSHSTLLVLHREMFYGILASAPVLRGNIEAAARSRMARPFPLRSTASDERVTAGVA